MVPTTLNNQRKLQALQNHNIETDLGPFELHRATNSLHEVRLYRKKFSIIRLVTACFILGR